MRKLNDTKIKIKQYKDSSARSALNPCGRK